MRKTLFSKCMNLHVCTILIAMLLLPAINLRANPSQAGIVSGIVTSASDDEPLIGVSVLVKGTSTGTITDLDGKYSLNASPGDILVFSYIGYKTQEIEFKGQAGLNVALSDDSELLDEVVVVGYGVQKKKLVTGATVQVKGDMLQQQNTTSPLQALQGQTPGVNIASTSGQPGSDMKVVIRGLGTVGNSAPLYIIDGVEGDISALNAADIESIDILKDAASAAIYGAQAANGVVLVTTKQGKEGKAQITFDAYFGIQSAARKVDMLNAEQYRVIMDEQALNSGKAVYDWDSMQSIWKYTEDASGNLVRSGLNDTDWIDTMLKDNAKTQSYNLGISGGSATSTYALSLGYLSQEGIVGGKDVSNFERYNFRINSEHKIYKDILKVGEHMSFIYTQNTGVNVGDQYNNTLRGAFITSPLAPVYSNNNPYPESPYNDTSKSDWYNADGNPYGQMMTNTNNLKDGQKFVGDVYAELTPMKGLKLKTVFGINYYATEYRSYVPLYHFSIYSYNDEKTEVFQEMSKGHTLTWTNTASYDFTIREHALSALIGMEAVRLQGTYISAGNKVLKSIYNDWQHAYVDNTESTNISDVTLSGKPENNYRRVSYFGRIGYNFREKYLFNATLRADASSKFSRGNRWGYFPSVSAGWVISQENFMNSTQTWMDFLKLRASWGQVGNQNIIDFAYAAPIQTANTNYIFGNSVGGDQNQWGAYQNRLANPDVTWETSEQFNAGIDARFLNNRFGVNADFYIKSTRDWLVQAPVLGILGAEAPYINGGDVKNTGFELALTWNDKIGAVNYNVGVNGSYNKNEVGKISAQEGIIHGKTNMLYDNSGEFYRAQEGYPIGYFWGYKTAGVFQNEEQIQSWRDQKKGILQKDAKPGDVIYVDQDNNGVIDEKDKVNLGNGMPKFSYGFNIGLEYKGFDFSVNAYGMAGNKIAQSYRNHGGNSKANYTSAILDRWTGEGTSNRMPRVTEANINWEFSDLYIQKGDFLRISNITLGYDFTRLIDLKFISQARVYAQVQNAFTFTNYDGMDPEIGYGPEDNGWVSGVDLGYYPRPHTFLFGVNLKF